MWKTMGHHPWAALLSQPGVDHQATQWPTVLTGLCHQPWRQRQRQHRPQPQQPPAPARCWPCPCEATEGGVRLLEEGRHGPHHRWAVWQRSHEPSQPCHADHGSTIAAPHARWQGRQLALGTWPGTHRRTAQAARCKFDSTSRAHVISSTRIQHIGNGQRTATGSHHAREHQQGHCHSALGMLARQGLMHLPQLQALLQHRAPQHREARSHHHQRQRQHQHQRQRPCRGRRHGHVPPQARMTQADSLIPTPPRCGAVPRSRRQASGSVSAGQAPAG